MKMGAERSNLVLRQATRWPRLFLGGDPRFSKWPGRRRWTQDWGFVPVRQSVAVKRRPSSDAERTRYDHDPGNYRTLCGNRCRQAWAGGSRGGGSGGQRAEIKTRWFATTMPALCGVPGFRIRTAFKKYSVEKDQQDPRTGAAASGTPSPPKGGRARKTKT